MSGPIDSGRDLFRAVVVLTALLLCVAAYAESPFLTKKPIPGKTAKDMIQRVVGVGDESAVWKYWGYELSNELGVVSTVVGVAYRPYASSDSVCRTYETYMETPSPWATRASSIETPQKSYEIHTYLFLAHRVPNQACSALALNRYFRVNTDITDEELNRFLTDLKLVLADWYSKNPQKQGEARLSLSDLSYIDIAEKDGQEITSFTLEIDAGKGGERAFKVETPVKGAPQYKTELVLP